MGSSGRGDSVEIRGRYCVLRYHGDGFTGSANHSGRKDVAGSGAQAGSCGSSLAEVKSQWQNLRCRLCFCGLDVVRS